MSLSAVVSKPATVFRLLRAPHIGVRWIGVALGVWIGLYPFADLALRPRSGDYLLHPGEDVAVAGILMRAYAAIIALGVVPILFGAFRYGIDFRRSKLFFLSIVLVCASIPLSLLSSSDLSNVSYIVLIYFQFAALALLLAENVRKDELMASFFTGLTLTLAAAMIVALIDHDYVWGRFVGRTAPDTWGGMALITIMGVIAMRGWFVRAALVGLSLFVIYVAQARADMMALVAGLAMAALLSTRHPKAGRRGWLLLAAGVAALGAVVIGSDFVFNELLRMTDSARGVGTGMSGRAALAHEAWDLIASHPLFGVGYRQHERYMTSQLPVHSVYLATLADTGVVGLLGYLIFFGGALLRAFVDAWNVPSGARIASASFLAAFAVLGIVEPSGVHTGNTLSMLMMFLAAWAWRTDPGGGWADPRRAALAPRPRDA